MDVEGTHLSDCEADTLLSPQAGSYNLCLELVTPEMDDRGQSDLRRKVSSSQESMEGMGPTPKPPMSP